jgi:hypothetical protein
MINTSIHIHFVALLISDKSDHEKHIVYGAKIFFLAITNICVLSQEKVGKKKRLFLVFENNK